MKISAEIRKRVVFTTFISLCLFVVGCIGQTIDHEKIRMNQALDHYHQGENHYERGQLESARDEFLVSADIYPIPRVYFVLANVQLQLGDEQGAIESLDRTLELSRGFVLAERLKEQLENGQPLKLKEDQTILSSTLERPALLGQSQTDSNLPDTSLKPVELDDNLPVAISPTPDPAAESVINQIKTTYDKGDVDEAYSLSLVAVKDYPESAKVQHLHGLICYQKGQMVDARDAFKKSTELNPYQADVFNDYGVVLQRLNNPLQAEKAYQKAVDLGTQNDALYNLALLKEQMGEYREAIKLYEKYLIKDSTSSYAVRAQDRIKTLRRHAY